MNNNPFNIPSLAPMHSAVVDFVEKYQGDKGFIFTQNSDCDTIWAMVWNDDDDFGYTEYEVKAIRVVGNGHLEVICDSTRINWSEQDVAEADNREWHSVEYDDNLVYLNTIFSIAENIAEYVTTEE